MSLLRRVPEDYKVCLLKNEFGDIAGKYRWITGERFKRINMSGYIVDSQLAKETNVGVQEMVNGCMCCVLVGQMKLALQELRGEMNRE